MIVLMLLTYSINAQETVKLDTVVLKGIRADKKTPVTQKTVTRAEIQKAYYGQEMPILLNTTPAITSNTDGGHPQGYTYFRLRGIDQTRINMTLNGVPLNEPEDQGVYFSNYPGFANNISSMQIQRGVGTSTNGVSSFGGSINFVSPKGINKSTSIEAEYGSWNTSRFNFEYESGLVGNDNFSHYLNISSFNTDGYKHHSGGKGYSVFYSGSFYGDTDMWTLTAFTGQSKNKMAWYAVSEEDIAIDPKTNYNHPDADDKFNQTLITLAYKNVLNSTSRINTTIFYNRLDGNWDLYWDDMLNFRLGSNFYGIISNYNYTPTNFDINVGVSANGYNRDHSMVVLPDTETLIYDNTGTKNEFSAYGKIKYDLDALTLFADAQVRNVNFKYDGDVNLDEQTWNFFNPKIGLTYNVSNNFKLYTTLGKSHREPTRSDMFGGEDNLIEFIEVTPEEVLDYELGINYSSENFSIQGNLYYMDFDNEITLLGSLGAYSLQQFGNVEQSYRAGLEVDLAYKLNNNFTVIYNGAFSDNEIKDQGVTFEPLYTPNVITNLAVQFNKGKIFADFAGKHHSESYIDFANENVTPSFVVFNASLGYVGNKFDVKLKGLNIFNEEYFTNGYMDGGVRNFYVNATASVYLTVKYKF